MNYLIEWGTEQIPLIRSQKVQYLPDINEVLLKAFGEDKATSVLIERIKENHEDSSDRR
jgi:hypothetical protein